MTSPPPPTVSVLIPTYKYARYLPQAIESVLNQSLTDFELIISDDDSNDGSAEIIRRYAAQDERIRLTVQSPNLGMVRNWNWCLEQARGQYIKYVFGDDFLVSRDAIGRFVEMMESAPDVRLAASARVVVDEQSRQVELWNNVQHSGVFDGTHVISWSLRANCNLVGEPSVVMFRRADAARGFDPAYKQVVDWEFWIHLLQRGNLAYTDVPLCAFRRHDLQQSAINCQAHGAASEHPELLRQYASYAGDSARHRQELFDRLYHLRRNARYEHPDSDMENALQYAIGNNYYACWLRHRATRLSFKARRFWLKYVVRQLPLDSPLPRYPLWVHTASGMHPSYVSCGADRLHGARETDRDTTVRPLHGDIQLVSELAPAYSYSRSMPLRILATREFESALLDHYSEIDRTHRAGDASWLAELTDATVAHNVLYLERGNTRHVVYETHRPPDRQDSPLLTDNAEATPYPCHRNTACFFLGSVGSNTYGHWLVDDFTRLEAFRLLRREYPDSQIEIVLSSQGRLDQCMHWNALRSAAIRKFLQGERNYRIRFINVMRPFHFKRLHYATPVSYHPVLKSPHSLHTLSENFTRPPAGSARWRGKRDEKIFVVRRAGRGRALQNMDALARLLERQGYRTIDVESMSIATQARVFANARIVVGLMGSAMTNTLFCKPGARLLYLAPEGWMEPFYWDLAAARGHVYLGCYGSTVPTFGPVHMTSFAIPQSTVLQALREIEF